MAEQTDSASSEPLAETLDDWVARSAAGLEGVSNTRSLDGLTVDSALKVVRDFVAERKLVLYGGLAIDYALRAGGHPPIYPDTERPDYDAYTSNHARDAYELGARLASLKFPAVSVLPAIHPQTIRVRVDFVVVADFSYLPAEVFARLPFRAYRGIRYVHPDFQRCDMHLDLSNPMAPGMRGATNLAFRGRKTARRLAMFDAAFPVGEAFGRRAETKSPKASAEATGPETTGPGATGPESAGPETAGPETEASEGSLAEGGGQTFSLNRHVYSVEHLWALAAKLPVTQHRVSDLLWMLEEPSWSKEGEPELSPAMVLDDMGSYPDHAARIRGADLSSILLVKRGHPDERKALAIVDGVHRLCRAALENRESIPGRVLTGAELKRALIGGGPPGGAPDVVSVARAYAKKAGGYVVWRALTGYAALAAYRAYYLRLRKSLPGLPERSAPAALCTAAETEPKSSEYSYEVRGVGGVVEVVAGSEGAPSGAETAGAAVRRPFLDLTPETWLLKEGRVRVGAHHRVRPGAVRLGEKGKPPVFAAHPAALQLYLLFEAWQAHWAGGDPAPHLAAYREFGEDLVAVRGELHALADRPGWSELVAECPFGYPLGQLDGCAQTDFNLANLAFTARDLRRPPPTDCGRPMRKQSDVPVTLHFDAMLRRAAAAAAMAEPKSTPVRTVSDGMPAEEVPAPAPAAIQLPTFEYGEHPDEIWLRDGGLVA